MSIVSLFEKAGFRHVRAYDGMTWPEYQPSNPPASFWLWKSRRRPGAGAEKIDARYRRESARKKSI